MPRMDGTGPMGAGTMTGRGLGSCTGINAVYGSRRGMGFGLACRRGFGRGFAFNQTSSKTQKELLNNQKAMMLDQLEIIEKQLEKL